MLFHNNVDAMFSLPNEKGKKKVGSECFKIIESSSQGSSSQQLIIDEPNVLPQAQLKEAVKVAERYITFLQCYKPFMFTLM